MDKRVLNILTCFLIVAAAIDGAFGVAMVNGVVFCDQCRDGRVSLFDYPLNGVKVGIICPGSDGGQTSSMIGEETTNMFGSYSMKLDGAPDLNNCYAQITSSGENNNGQGSKGCQVTSGPSKPVKLMFSMFDMEMYQADVLISQPANPMSFCQGGSSPGRPPAVKPPPSSATPTPSSPPSPPTTPIRRSPPSHPAPPSISLPPLPPIPPMPFLQPSSCSHEYWMKPEYSCYWRAIRPDMKVAFIFGPPAAKRYGTNMTLWAGLQGKADPYRTLLREATTSLLNSYNSLAFPYNALTVVEYTTTALLASQRTVLHTALRFKRANYGTGDSTCKFRACK